MCNRAAWHERAKLFASTCRADIDFDHFRLATDRYQCALRSKAIAGVREFFEAKSKQRTCAGIRRVWQARPYLDRAAGTALAGKSQAQCFRLQATSAAAD